MAYGFFIKYFACLLYGIWGFLSGFTVVLGVCGVRMSCAGKGIEKEGGAVIKGEVKKVFLIII